MVEMKKQRQKQKKKSQMFGVLSVVVFAGALFLSIFGLSRTMTEVKQIAVSKKPEAILASAGVSDNKSVSLSVVYYDQKADECVDMYDISKKVNLEARQFGWHECGYYNRKMEQGLVDFYLGEDYLPIAKGGELTSNRGLKDISRWFNEVEGKSKSYTGLIKMDYKADGAEFSFHQENFYPLDEVDSGKGEAVNSDGHNHLFTMNFAVPFTVLLSGDEKFSIMADDDTFVFVGDKLAIDMGGIHEAMIGNLEIRENGEIYSAVGGDELAYSGINVESGTGSIVRIFHADRDEEDSVFKVKFSEMNLTIADTKLAEDDGDDLQIAYDPNDPSYVAPLGESAIVRPDGTKGHIIIATIEGVMIVTLAILIVLSVSFLVKQKIEK